MHRHPTPEEIRHEILMALYDDAVAVKLPLIPMRVREIINAAITRACDKHDAEMAKEE